MDIKEKKLVSVVIPVYNREKYIEKALKSAVSQTYPNLEIIVIDNQSTDATWEILTNWQKVNPKIHIYRNETNIGPVLNWKRGFELATGEYIKILWSDDWMADDFVEKAIQLMDDDTAFVMSWYHIMGDKGILASSSYTKTYYTRDEYLRNMLYITRVEFPVSPGCALFRKKDLNSSFVVEIPNRDGLDSRCNGAGNDLLLFLNTAMHYAKIGIVPSYGNFFRLHSDSFTIRNELSLYYLWAKLFFLQTRFPCMLYTDALKFRLYRSQLRNKKYRNIYQSIRPGRGYAYHCLQFLCHRYL